MYQDASGDHGAVPTIRDVAERAGVAISTVSRALSNPKRVNVRTRERIERMASEPVTFQISKPED